jgi:hypothetical protein
MGEVKTPKEGTLTEVDRVSITIRGDKVTINGTPIRNKPLADLLRILNHIHNGPSYERPEFEKDYTIYTLTTGVDEEGTLDGAVIKIVEDGVVINGVEVRSKLFATVLRQILDAYGNMLHPTEEGAIIALEARNDCLPCDEDCSFDVVLYREGG